MLPHLIQAKEKGLNGFLIGYLPCLIMYALNGRVNPVRPDEVVSSDSPLYIGTLKAVNSGCEVPASTTASLGKEDVHGYLTADAGVFPD